MATAPLPQNDDNSDANNGKREQGEGSHAAAEIARCDVTRSTSKRGRTERRAGQVVTDEVRRLFGQL